MWQQYYISVAALAFRQVPFMYIPQNTNRFYVLLISARRVASRRVASIFAREIIQWFLINVGRYVTSRNFNKSCLMIYRMSD